MYFLSKKDKSDLLQLEKDLFHSNGIPKYSKSDIIHNEEVHKKFSKLVMLYAKKEELLLASMN